MRPLGQFEWQRAIFAEKLNRFELISIAKDDDKLSPIEIRVYRNHAFELVASILPTFLAFSGLRCDLTLSAYDDSVQAQEGAAAAEIIWIDFQRYGQLPTEALCNWFIERLEAVRTLSRAPLIVANSPGDTPRDELLNERLKAWSATTPSTAILDLRAIAGDLGSRFFDQRRKAVTGTSLSDAASLEVARALGLVLLPGFFLPPIKAIALDLDHTLYSGVLGEDGPSGVLLTPSHLELQATLKMLSKRGLLLAVVSRNEREDVDALFEKRGDFALRPEDIASWQVSWGSKADGIRKAAKEFRIAPDSFLFVDDNAGELGSVAVEEPGVKLLFAGFSAEQTCATLRRFPALWSAKVSETDALRAADLRASRARAALRSEADADSYLRDLNVELRFSINPTEDLSRLRDICTKTNQFNLNLARLDELQIQDYLTSPERRVVHVRLSDRLSDSGSVGAMFVRREGNVLAVDELCISCRAMGRSLEGVIVTEGLRRILEDLPAQAVRFAYSAGPRNQPAREWLRAYADVELDGADGIIEFLWNEAKVSSFLKDAPVKLEWIGR
jgi:FkbH-like protein